MSAGKVRADLSGLIERLKDGMTLGIGGFGLDRKPMTLIAAIAGSQVKGLTIETYAGGFDIEVLVAAGKVGRVESCHVGLDQFGLAPRFRAARESGLVTLGEWSELSQLQAWRAAADRIPFVPVDMDHRSALLDVNPALRLAKSPFDDSPAVVAKAPRIDLAILHAEAAHADGWAVAAGDPYLDTVLARAAHYTILSAERLMDDAELERRHREVHLLASYVDEVVVAPGGALPGSCLPVHMIDFLACRTYCESEIQNESAVAAALEFTPRISVEPQ